MSFTVDGQNPKVFIKDSLKTIEDKVHNLKKIYSEMSPEKLDSELKVLNAMFSKIEYKVLKGMQDAV